MWSIQNMVESKALEPVLDVTHNNRNMLKYFLVFHSQVHPLEIAGKEKKNVDVEKILCNLSKH